MMQITIEWLRDRGAESDLIVWYDVHHGDDPADGIDAVRANELVRELLELDKWFYAAWLILKVATHPDRLVLIYQMRRETIRYRDTEQIGMLLNVADAFAVAYKQDSFKLMWQNLTAFLAIADPDTNTIDALCQMVKEWER